MHSKKKYCHSKVFKLVLWMIFHVTYGGSIKKHVNLHFSRGKILFYFLGFNWHENAHIFRFNQPCFYSVSAPRVWWTVSAQISKNNSVWCKVSPVLRLKRGTPTRAAFCLWPVNRVRSSFAKQWKLWSFDWSFGSAIELPRWRGSIVEYCWAKLLRASWF